MFTATRAARTKLKHFLGQMDAVEDCAIRLSLDHQGDGFSMEPDTITKADYTFAFDHRTVLIVAENVLDSLENKTLDIQSKGGGVRFTLH